MELAKEGILKSECCNRRGSACNSLLLSKASRISYGSRHFVFQPKMWLSKPDIVKERPSRRSNSNQEHLCHSQKNVSPAHNKDLVCLMIVRERIIWNSGLFAWKINEGSTLQEKIISMEKMPGIAFRMIKSGCKDFTFFSQFAFFQGSIQV